MLPVEWTENILPGLVVPTPTLPSFLTNKREVEAELITDRAAVAEVEPPPSIVVRAHKAVLVPMPMLFAVERKIVEVASSVLVPL